MSDTDSNDDNATSHPSHSRESQPIRTLAERDDLLPSDFPLSSRTLLNSVVDTAIDTFSTQITTLTNRPRVEQAERRFAALSLGAEQWTSARRASNSTNGSSISPHSNVAFMNVDTPHGPAPAVSRWDQTVDDTKVVPLKSTKTITTVTTALPTTPYKEEADDAPRSLEYIHIQRKMLKYLKERPADSLDAIQACSWTRKIVPSGQTPKIEEAVRLCYYMRSLGFDVYARFHKKFLALFVVNQKLNERGAHLDYLYWRQEIATGILEYQARPAQPSTRRNALDPFTALFEVGSTSSMSLHQQLTPGLRDARSAAPAPSSEPGTSSARARPSNNEAALRAAEARLNAELAGNMDPDTIQAALSQIEQLSQHAPQE